MTPTLLAAAICGIVSGASGQSDQGPNAIGTTRAITLDDGGDKHQCRGQNACKGQGGCKTDQHACRGRNACKGQGGCKH